MKILDFSTHHPPESTLSIRMGFHFEEDFIVDGSIDNRSRDLTVIRINFTNHTSSLITLQGNPCRDLAGSLWIFQNPHAQMDDRPGEPCFFIPPLCEGVAGRITYTRKRNVPILPPEQHYEQLFDVEREDPPTKIAPVLELEWFSQKYKQVEIDCAQMTLKLVEMVWSLSAEEAIAGEAIVNSARDEILLADDNWMGGYNEDVELINEYLEEESEPHELEELCFLIVQDFVIHRSNESKEMKELHNHLLKLQEQIGDAFTYVDDEGNFEEIPETIRLMGGLLPFIDRAIDSSQYHAETTFEHLHRLKQGITNLRDELARQKRE